MPNPNNCLRYWDLADHIRIDDAQIRKQLRTPLCKRATVPYRNPYQTRHTFASTRLTEGHNPYWLASQLGHEDVEMVFKVYGKWIPENFKAKNPCRTRVEFVLKLPRCWTS